MGERLGAAHWQPADVRGVVPHVEVSAEYVNPLSDLDVVSMLSEGVGGSRRGTV